jgi:chromosome segregation protein
VKWVLGEQRPTSLRGKEMMDVIFSGTDKRKSLGYAEVGLIFDNADGMLPLDFAEVSVTRRLYRSGESEYMLNGSRVRLRDIRELLMDSGGGPGALTVMEQGNIDRLLRADPQERRLVFEEAAGISKYRARRKETQRKLDRTHENLARLRDILGEYETRQRSLKIQAGKARRYSEFTEELKRKRLVGALARYRDLFGRQASAEEVLRELTDLEGGARQALEEAMESTTGQRARLDALRETTVGKEAESSRLYAEARADEEKRSALLREATQLELRADAAEREGGEAAARAASLRTQLESAHADLDAAAVEEAKRDEVLEAADALFREAEERVDLLRNERDELDMRRTDAFATETEARNEEISFEAEARALRGRLERLAERVRTSDVEMEQLRVEHASSRKHLDETEARFSKLDEEHAAAEAGARATRGELDAAAGEEQEHTGRAAALSARRDMLEGLVEKGEGLDAGTKAVLHAARQGALEGVRGTVAELIDDPGAQADALDRALGALAGAVVVETTAHAKAALTWLQLGKRGQACLLPLDRLPAAELPARFAGVTSRIALGSLLTGTDVVGDLEEALARPVGRRIVVLSGGELGAEGTLTGGSVEQGSGLIRQRAELAEVRTQLEEAITIRDAAATRVAQARARATQWDESLEDLRPRLKQAAAERRTAGEIFAAADKAASARADEMDLERAERSEVEVTVTSCESSSAAARERRETAESLRKGLEAESGELGVRIQRAQAAREEAASRRMDAKVDAARWTEKAQGLRRRAADLEASIGNAAREAETRATEVKQSLERKAICLREAQTILEQSAERTVALDALKAEIDELRGRARGLQDQLDQGDKRLRELRDAHEKHRAEMERHRLQEHELRLRLEGLLERVRIDFERSRAARPGDQRAAAEAGATGQRQPRRPRGARGGRGEARLHAPRGGRSGQRGKAAHGDHREDRRGVHQPLQLDLRRGDRAFQDGLPQAVRRRPRGDLPRGSRRRARLRHRNPRPPAGQGAAQHGAALRWRAYTVRMCEMIREFSDRGQFLIITHARPTMTIADTLYGVTMPEAGVSRRVAVRFEDIEAGSVVGLN